MAGKRWEILCPLRFLDTNKRTVLVQLLFLVCPRHVLLNHDIARNESWRLINLGHLEWEGKGIAHLLSHSLHLCGTSVIYIFHKRRKKKNLKGFIEPHWLREAKLAVRIRVGRIQRAWPGTALDLPQCSAGLNSGRECSEAATTEGGGVPKVAGVDGSGVSSAVYCFKMV